MLESKYSIIQRKSSTLFRGEDKTTHQAVMLKKISFSSISPKKKERIVNEVNTLVRMDYVHILRYLDFEINKRDLTVDIAMQYCEGGTLHDLIGRYRSDGKRIEEDRVWRIFYQLAQAIDYIHKDGIIHRNVNPSNIYFRENKKKNIKLGGFSLSKRIDIEETLASTVLPHTCYLSPEQIQSGTCTSQTDVWALGCLMYEVCMLQNPFRHANQFEKAKMIKEFRPKKVSSYSLELNRIIFWCLEKNPQDRPALADILGSPEINMRIRERRLRQKQAELLIREQTLNQKQKDLLHKENQLLKEQKMLKRFQTLKKKNNEVFSNRNLNYFKNTC